LMHEPETSLDCSENYPGNQAVTMLYHPSKNSRLFGPSIPYGLA
jgi:hypothetical protein